MLISTSPLCKLSSYLTLVNKKSVLAYMTTLERIIRHTIWCYYAKTFFESNEVLGISTTN